MSIFGVASVVGVIAQSHFRLQFFLLGKYWRLYTIDAKKKMYQKIYSRIFCMLYSQL